MKGPMTDVVRAPKGAPVQSVGLLEELVLNTDLKQRAMLPS